MRLRVFFGAVVLAVAWGALTACAQQEVGGMVPSSPGVGEAARVLVPIEKDWLFFKGDEERAPSAAFDDATWRKVDVPHDWSIEGPFAQNAATGGAGADLPSGVAWYRKTFSLPAGSAGKRVLVEFDGVMANSEVYINNACVGRRAYGYVGFDYDLTDYVDFAGKNVLAVRTDTSRQPASRWYTGAGIYRHVRLVLEDPVHLEHWGTVITTPQIAANSATVHVRTTVVNQSTAGRHVTVMATIIGPAGSAPDGAYACAGGSPEVAVAAGGTAEVSFDVVIPWQPRLWDVTHPDLHTARVRVMEGGRTLDETSLPFGIRTAEFKADTGFWLNGKNSKLLGVALHHDAGALGAAVPASAWESRLAALKKLGVNAIRTAHNPPSPELLDACDRLGLLVMDEAFDAWTVGKEPGDYHLYFKDWWQRDLTAMIARDRNHPSVVIYSLGNEIWDILPQNPDPAWDANTGAVRSIAVARDLFVPMRDLAHELDPTRPVTLAILRPNVSGIYSNGFAELMDVVGQNYRDNELAAAHVQNPARKIMGTENYHERPTWLALRDNPALAGQFLWSGVDYLGEARGWPAISSGSGLLDRTNYPKNNAFERASWWSSKPVVFVTRAQAVGRPAATASMPATNVNAPPVRPAPMLSFHDWTPVNTQPHEETVNVYSNCAQVELFFNGRSLGSKAQHADAAPRQWQVGYQAGVLRAVGRDAAGQVEASDEIGTAGAPAKIMLQTERPTLPNDWDDVAYVRALVVDANGTVNPNATNLVRFAIGGPGRIAAVDNGSLTDHDPFQATQRRAYQGTCVAIVRATAEAGRMVITASAEGLSSGSVELEAAPAKR